MNGPIPFMQPRMLGDRFQDHAIPLEILKDLAVLEEMIIEVAKWCFLQEHPERQRSPRGFADGISLMLTGILNGSAVPQIALCEKSSEVLSLVSSSDRYYFDRAKERIFGAIRAAANDEPITTLLPKNLLGYFDRMGRGLRDGEVIEFDPSSNSPARFDKAVRHKLVFASQAQELTEEVTLRGTVPEADQERLTFSLQVLDGPRVNAPITDQHQETILRAFNGFQQGVRVQIHGIGRYNRANRLQSIDEIAHINTLDPLDVIARLDEFRTLKDGWLDGKGRAPSQNGLNWFADRFQRHYLGNLPLPYIYPTAEGGIQAEWSLNGHEASLEIDFNTNQGEWHCLNIDTEAENNRVLDLNGAEDWKWFMDQVLQLLRDLE